jgi:hypothetical protein
MSCLIRCVWCCLICCIWQIPRCTTEGLHFGAWQLVFCSSPEGGVCQQNIYIPRPFTPYASWLFYLGVNEVRKEKERRHISCVLVEKMGKEGAGLEEYSRLVTKGSTKRKGLDMKTPAGPNRANFKRASIWSPEVGRDQKCAYC